MSNLKFGLKDANWKIVDELLLTPLKRQGCKVYVFGSRANGKHRPFSDLDVLIEGKIPKGLLAKIREELEESLLPITVDLVPFDELAENYKEQVLRERVAL